MLLKSPLLADVPARTVQQWAVDGIVAPSYTNPALGVHRPIYVLGDVIRLRLTRDLLDAGIDRAVIAVANQELTTHPQSDRFWDQRSSDHKRWWLYLPYLGDLLPELQQRDQNIIYFVGDDVVAGRLQQPEPGYRLEHLGPSILVYVDDVDDPEIYTGPIAICYPLWQAINDLTHAIEVWRCKNGIKLHDLPPWM